MATPPKPIKQAQQAALAPSLAAAAASNVVTAQELAASALQTDSENGQQLPLTENNYEANTIKTGMALTGTGALPSAGLPHHALARGGVGAGAAALPLRLLARDAAADAAAGGLV